MLKIRFTAEPVRLLIFELSASPVVDLAGARMRKTLHEALQTAAIEMKVIAAHGDAREMLRADDLEDRLGLIDRRNSVAHFVDEFRSRKV
ncbi:STAS domain-containing protein [Paraburkholderia xenovorans]|uniref:hypothetical protein n=1 Tax=Paraburkholderia xenovorans TaxID=36873 RepID=UPI0038B8A7C0